MVSSKSDSAAGGTSPPERIDGFLTKKAQTMWPAATVWCLNEHTSTERWELRRPGEREVLLGRYFGLARQSVEALVSAEEARRKG